MKHIHVFIGKKTYGPRTFGTRSIGPRAYGTGHMVGSHLVRSHLVRGQYVTGQLVRRTDIVLVWWTYTWALKAQAKLTIKIQIHLLFSYGSFMIGCE